MQPRSDAEATLHAQVAAHESWARTEDRSARTSPARAAYEQRFLDLAGGDPVRAAHLRTAHYKRMALRSAASRRRNAAARILAQAEQDEAQAEQLDGA